MNFLNLVNARYSQRGYLNKDIEQDKIDYILKCIELTPSAANKQPWNIYLVKDLNTRKKLVTAYKKTWMSEAPYIIIFTGIMGQNWTRKDGQDYLMCDITIIADYFILAATEVGLGTCYVAAFDEKLVCEALKLPEGEKPFLMTPLGYAKDGVSKERKRKELNEIIKFI